MSRSETACSAELICITRLGSESARGSSCASWLNCVRMRTPCSACADTRCPSSSSRCCIAHGPLRHASGRRRLGTSAQRLYDRTIEPTANIVPSNPADCSACERTPGPRLPPMSSVETKTPPAPTQAPKPNALIVCLSRRPISAPFPLASCFQFTCEPPFCATLKKL